MHIFMLLLFSDLVLFLREQWEIFPPTEIAPSRAAGEVCLSVCAGSSEVAMQQSKQATEIFAGIDNSVIRTINLSCSSAVTSGWPKKLPLK